MENRIKMLRLESGMTQKELAKKLNINNSQISRYEKGLLEPNQDTLTKMSEIFNCSIDYILGNSDFKNNESDDYTFVIERAKSAKITPEKLRQLIDLLSQK